MKLRRFTGATTQEALRLVKRVLGDEAVILETEQVPGGVVVTAAIDSAVAAYGQEETIRREARALATAASTVDAEHALALERSLARQGVDGVLAAAWLREIRAAEAGGSMGQALAAVLRRQTGPAVLSPVECFIGPPGDGKTTTVVKLAARARRAGAQVAIVSTDTHRVGAAAELEIYGRALGIVTARATSADELAATVKGLHACGHVLIDTAGVGAGENGARDELQGLLEALGTGVTRTLVVSAGSNATAAARLWESFAQLRPAAGIMTKRDLAPGAPLLAQLWRAGVPVTHLTTGRRIPDDIEAATPVRLAEALLAA